MTREEKINTLKAIIQECEEYQCQRKEILFEIIKALEQEPCEDWYDVPSDEMTLEQARQAVKDLRKKLIEYLEQEPRWIPVSERLPKEEVDVLICNERGEIELSRGSYSTELNDCWIWYTSGWRFGDVIAWMPLPKPYKAEIEG